jgi:hypothetical protein
VTFEIEQHVSEQSLDGGPSPVVEPTKLRLLGGLAPV